MRRPQTTARRILTLICLLALTLSFVAVDASSPSHKLDQRHAGKLLLKRQGRPVPNPPAPPTRPGGGNAAPPGGSSSSTSSTSTTSTSTTSSSSTTSTTSTRETSSSTTETTTSTSTTSSSSSSTESTSTTSSSESTSTTSSTTPLTSSSTSSSLQTTLIVTPTGMTTTIRNVATGIGNGFTSVPTSQLPIATIDGSTAVGGKEEPKSFLQNTGAVAATFSIVGVLVVAVLAAGIMIWRKKKRSEEHDIFESEYNDYSGDAFKGGHTTSFGDSAPLAAAQSTYYNNAYPDSPGSQSSPQIPHSNRSSIVSNYAGFGAFKKFGGGKDQHRVAQPPIQPMRQQSSLRNEAYSAKPAPPNKYTEPAVDENQSIYLVPAPQTLSREQRVSADSFYSQVTNNKRMSYMSMGVAK